LAFDHLAMRRFLRRALGSTRFPLRCAFSAPFELFLLLFGLGTLTVSALHSVVGPKWHVSFARR
jgi:hypothetical protein